MKDDVVARLREFIENEMRSSVKYYILCFH